MRRAQDHFDRDDTLLCRAGYQALADHRHEVLRQVRQHLVTGVVREEAGGAFHGMAGAGAVQRGQAQVAGFGVVQGVLHGFQVTDFADHDHVRRLAQHVAQCLGEAVGVQPDLALVDDRATVGVEELDGVFHADDVPAAPLVAEIQHGRQGGRLPAAGRADHQDQAAIL
ncbi:hypothetical protein D9M70_557390 [compost metagenome]